MKHKKKKETTEGKGDNVLTSQGEIGTPTIEIIDLTRRLLELEERYEKEKQLTSELYEQKERLEIELYDHMKNVGIEQFRTAEFGLISCANRLWGKITNLEIAEKWLKDNGLFHEVLKLKPVVARVNEIIKKRLEEGQSIPPGFDYTLTRTINHRSK